MLWLAGLLGLMAVGTAAYVDVGAGTDASDDDEPDFEDRTDTDFNLILGTGFGDMMTGTDMPDRIDAGAGDDLVEAGDGGDEALGGDGNDTLSGDAGSDTLRGEDGADALFGGTEDDHLIGNNDDDRIAGGSGDDTLNGSAGDDWLAGGDGDDALSGGLGADTLSGDAGADTLFGGAGDDLLVGSLRAAARGGEEDAVEVLAETDGDALPPEKEEAAAPAGDFLNGGGGDDIILAGRGDIAHGGSGADTLVLGDWLDGDGQASIIDFTAAEDELVFIWDDGDPDAPPPEVEVRADPDREGALQVWMGEALVARVSGPDALEGAEISLIPLSAASEMALVPPAGPAAAVAPQQVAAQ